MARKPEEVVTTKPEPDDKPPGPSPLHPYSQELVAALEALGRYESHGNGVFIWQAYEHARAGLRAFPSYRHELFMYLSWKRPKWKTSEHDIKDTHIREVLEQVLIHLDAIAKDLLEVGGTSSRAGVAALRKALRMQEDLNPVSAEGLVTEQKIVQEFLFQMQALSVNQERFGHKTPPPDAVTWNFTRVRNNVAEEIGVSNKHAGETIGRYLARHPDQKAKVDLVFDRDKGLKQKKLPTKKSPKKKAKTTNSSHPWRTKKIT